MKVSLLLLIAVSVFLLEADQQKPESRDTSTLIASAEKGNADAQFNLGLMYAKGNGVEPDQKAAVKWWQRAAKQGQAMAQFNLGLKYADGDGVKQDFKQAEFWVRKAADQGGADVQHRFGHLNLKGVAVGAGFRRSKQMVPESSRPRTCRCAKGYWATVFWRDRRGAGFQERVEMVP